MGLECRYYWSLQQVTNYKNIDNQFEDWAWSNGAAAFQGLDRLGHADAVFLGLRSWVRCVPPWQLIRENALQLNSC